MRIYNGKKKSTKKVKKFFLEKKKSENQTKMGNSVFFADREQNKKFESLEVFKLGTFYCYRYPMEMFITSIQLFPSALDTFSQHFPNVSSNNKRRNENKLLSNSAGYKLYQLLKWD